MRNRFIALILALSSIFTILSTLNVSTAATRSTSNTRSDGVATVTKSAKWTNTGKTEAEITIEVQTNKVTKTELPDVKDADIIFIVDRSTSAFDNISLTHKTMLNDVVKDATKYFLTGSYASKNNRVAYADFASAVYVYKTALSTNSNTSSSEWTNAARPLHFGNGNYGLYYKDADNKKYPALSSVNDITTYAAARDRFYNIAKSAGALNFYTNTTLIDNMLTNSTRFNPVGSNTNIDLPLLWAESMLKNRTGADANRKAYIIFITDGQPYPVTDKTRKNQASSSAWKNSDYAANKFSKEAANTLRNTYGAEIYTIIVDTNAATKDNAYPLWDAITGDSGSSATKNTEHIYSVANTKNSTTAKNKINEILKLIETDMKNGNVKTNTATLNATLTDVINTDIFELLSTNSKVTLSTNIGTASIGSDNKTITWKFSGIAYGAKCSDGKWPTLTIKVKLKDASRYGDDLNTNWIKPNDDNCVLTHPEGPGVKVPTPWLEREAPGRSVTVKYIDDDTNTQLYVINVPNVTNGSSFPTSGSIKSKYAVTDLKGTFGIPGYELVTDKVVVDGKTYTTSNMPNTITVNANKTIEFYYRKAKATTVVRTFIVNTLDDAIVDIKSHSSNRLSVSVDELQSYTAPNVGSYEYLGYRFQKNTPLAVDTRVISTLDAEETVVDYTLSNNETAYIDFYYLNAEYTYTVTVKYIDDTTQKVLHSIVIPKITKNTVFPATGIISSKYLVKDLKGTFGIAGYNLMTNKVIVDGKIYATTSMPKTLTVNKNITVEFYYKPKEVEANIRTFIVTKIDDVITGVKNNSTNKTTVYVNRSYTEAAPNMSNYQYLGHTVKYNTIPIITSNTLTNLNNSSAANYQLSAEDKCAYVDFIYLDAYNTVIVKYQDTYGNTIRSDVTELVKQGTNFTPDVPGTITNNGTIYDYQSRDDGKAQTTVIGPVNNKTVVIIKYKARGHKVTVKYKDIITNETLKQDVVTDNVPEYTTYTPTENGVPSKYTFVKRSDGKTRNAGIEVTTADREVTFYYINLVDGRPIVSYPSINSAVQESGKSVVTLGEKFEITIPSKGAHTQMNNLGVQQPANGWNSVYARSEYLIFSCDVVYNNAIVKAGNAIMVAQNANGGIGNTTVSIIIPEYVEEKDYVVTAIVSNLSQKQKDTSTNAGYNLLYSESEAVGTLEFRVKGKIYDFTITNLVGDNFWPTSAFNNIQGYKAGAMAANQIAQLPIGQRTMQNSKYKYGIALGSSFYFNLNTIGIKNSKISIVPKLIYVDSNGAQKEVDIYSRNAAGQYVLLPAGSEVKLTTKLNSDVYRARTNLVNELTKGIKLYGNTVYSVTTDIGTHKQLTLDEKLKTPFVNFFTEENKTYYNNVSDAVRDDVLKAVNHWYGYYSLPYTTKVMEKGASINDGSKEIKTGFIIVLFKITSQDSSGSEYLVYDNQAVGNQWKNEGGAANNEQLTIHLPNTGASTNTDTVIKVESGYYPVAIYGAGTRLNYDTAGIH